MKFIMLLLFGLYNFYLIFSWVPALMSSPVVIITILIALLVFAIVGISSLGDKNP